MAKAKTKTREVTAAEKAIGIESWFAVTSPLANVEMWLPRFDASFFDEVQRAKIPAESTYVDHQNLEYDAALAWHFDETLALFGEAGVGKTAFWEHLAYRMNLPFERISITGQSDVDDLIGMWTANEGTTYWHNGRIPESWSRPCVIALDEPNLGPPPVWEVLRPLTDDSKQLILDQADGRRIERHMFCFFGMAMNPPWEPRYRGAQEISDADGNRLVARNVTPPPAEIETEILQAAAPDLSKDKIASILKISDKLREMSMNQEISISWGVRPNKKVARFASVLDITEAYNFAVLSRLGPEDAETIGKVIAVEAK